MFSLLIPQEIICVDLLRKNSKQLRDTMFVSPEIKKNLNLNNVQIIYNGLIRW